MHRRKAKSWEDQRECWREFLLCHLVQFNVFLWTVLLKLCPKDIFLLTLSYTLHFPSVLLALSGFPFPTLLDLNSE